MRRGDVYVINSKFKTLETVKVKKINGDQVECVILEGSQQWVGDKVTLSLTKTDFAAFVENDYTPTFLDKVKKFWDNIKFDPFVFFAVGVVGVIGYSVFF